MQATPISNQTFQGNTYLLDFKPGHETPKEPGYYLVLADAGVNSPMICKAEFAGEEFLRFVTRENDTEIRDIAVLAHAKLPTSRTILQNLYPVMGRVLPFVGGDACQ